MHTNLKEMKDIMRDAIRPCLVAKIESDRIPTQFQNWYPILNDCFLIGEETINNFATNYYDKNNGNHIVKPSSGSKFIGAYRDKGSITGCLKRYLPFCQYQLNNLTEVNNFTDMLKAMNKEYKIIGENMIEFQLDIIADVSTGRDNVTPLILNSCLELTAIIEDRDIEMSIKEINAINIIDVVNSRKFDHVVIIRDMEQEGKIVYSFGEVGILLEDFFWQPSHDNKLCCGEKEISFNYHQSIDAMAVLAPTLYDVTIESLNYASISEDIILLGLEMSETMEDIEPYTNMIVTTNETSDNEEL